MDSKQDTMQQLSKEEAIKLLFNMGYSNHNNQDCFDEFGNYIFPTDLVAITPNTASGTSSGLSFINSKTCKEV